MSICYRFEDMHGLYSLMIQAKAKYNPDVINFINNSNTNFLLDKDTYIQRGLKSDSIFDMLSVNISNYKYHNVDKVVLLFDFDDSATQNKTIMIPDRFKYKSKKTIEFQKLYNIPVYYMPVIYCAESIAVYNYMKLDMDNIISNNIINGTYYSDNVAELHGRIFDACIKFNNYNCSVSNERKKTYKYADINNILKNSNGVKSFNSKLFEWFKNNCSNNFEFYNFDDTVELITRVNERYNNLCYSNINIDINNEKLNLTELSFHDTYIRILDALRNKNNKNILPDLSDLMNAAKMYK